MTPAGPGPRPFSHSPACRWHASHPDEASASWSERQGSSVSACLVTFEREKQPAGKWLARQFLSSWWARKRTDRFQSMIANFFKRDAELRKMATCWWYTEIPSDRPARCFGWLLSCRPRGSTHLAPRPDGSHKDGRHNGLTASLRLCFGCNSGRHGLKMSANQDRIGTTKTSFCSVERIVLF